MTSVSRSTAAKWSFDLRLGAVSGLLALVAALAGLLIPSFYNAPLSLTTAMRGQDAVTLAAVAALALVSPAAARGSRRARLAWLGLMGYLLYTYMGAAYAYPFNALCLLYIAAFVTSGVALASAALSLNADRLKAAFDAGTPRRAVAAFLGFMAVLVALPELSQVAGYWFTGRLPDLVARAGGNNSFVYTQDLGLVLPLMVLAAVWLWQDRAWGFVLAGALLVKAVTMGLALLSMTAFSVQAGQPLEVGFTVIYAVITLGSLGFGAWFARHART